MAGIKLKIWRMKRTRELLWRNPGAAALLPRASFRPQNSEKRSGPIRTWSTITVSKNASRLYRRITRCQRLLFQFFEIDLIVLFRRNELVTNDGEFSVVFMNCRRAVRTLLPVSVIRNPREELIFNSRGKE
jgi:hypothetical protein